MRDAPMQQSQQPYGYPPAQQIVQPRTQHAEQLVVEPGVLPGMMQPDMQLMDTPGMVTPQQQIPVKVVQPAIAVVTPADLAVLSGNIAASLGYLAHSKGLFVREDNSMLHYGIGADREINTYAIKPFPSDYDPRRQNICSWDFSCLPTHFTAIEQSVGWGRACCGPKRAFRMLVKDAFGADVLRLERPLKCDVPCGIWPFAFVHCHPQVMDIFAALPGGDSVKDPKLATVRRSRGCRCCDFQDRLEVRDAHDDLQYIISGSSLQCGPNCICTSYELDILEPDGTHTGAYIRNVYAGCVKTFFAKADNLLVTFPAEADAAQRAALLGATLLVDYMYFEQHGVSNE